MSCILRPEINFSVGINFGDIMRNSLRKSITIDSLTYKSDRIRQTWYPLTVPDKPINIDIWLVDNMKGQFYYDHQNIPTPILWFEYKEDYALYSFTWC